MSAVSQLHIAIAVQGRLHAFDLAKALARQPNTSVSLLTNYSHRECATFEFPTACALAHFTAHRWLQAAIFRTLRTPLPRWADALLHESFGRWAAHRLSNWSPRPQVLRIFSGVALESLKHPGLASALRIVARGSSHIAAQRKILEAEEQRAGTRLDKPSDYMLNREQQEYALADSVVVLSSFARKTFLDEGHPDERVWLAPNAVDLSWYGATLESLVAREKRVLQGGPLRVLTVGSFSYRKGILDLEKVARQLSGRFLFRFVGDLPPEGLPVRKRLASQMEFRERVPPQKLREEYAWGDIFLFPTIEDGFPASLSQALAAGLPAITTPHGSGPDLIRDGINGWLLPVRAGDEIIHKLESLEQNRRALLACGVEAARSIASRGWDEVAADFVAEARKRLALKAVSRGIALPS